MSAIVAAPIVVALATVVATLAAWRSLAWQRALSIAGSAILLVASLALFQEVEANGRQVTQLGGWPAPYGIVLVADLASAILVVLTAVTGLVVGWYARTGVDDERQASGFHPLFHVLIAGVCGAFLTGDLFNLYVWFEVLLMGSFALMSLGGTRRQLRGGIQYVALNLISSAVFLAAVGVLYGVSGSLNFAELSQSFARAEPPLLGRTLAALFLVAFGVKAALFPFFFWLPASYPAPGMATAGLFAALLTKVGVYAILRTFTLVDLDPSGVARALLLALSGITMVVGIVCALGQGDVRRILAFQSVSKIGYMLAGVAIGTPLAIAGTLVFLVHHGLVKGNLFLIAGVMRRVGGSFRLAELGGLASRAPLLAVVFFLSALSIAGVPPFSGFWAKLVLVKAALEAGEWAIVAVMLAVGLLTLWSLMQVWSEAFWRAPRETPQRATSDERVRTRALLAPIAALALCALLVGLLAGPAVDLALRAAEQLLDAEGYREAVLGSGER